MKNESYDGYRIPLGVTEARQVGRYAFPVCPHCGVTVEREYQAFCDRCGQALQWKKYAEILKEAKRKKNGVFYN